MCFDNFLKNFISTVHLKYVYKAKNSYQYTIQKPSGFKNYQSCAVQIILVLFVILWSDLAPF